MGDTESDEHLRIFKCLVDTGAVVLRNAVELKLLKNNSITFVQYLDNNKHQFYHQFEKNRNNPCCSRTPHGCSVTGYMDKNIFYKLFNKKGQLDMQLCLDRFEVKPGISIDQMDLSDLHFLLWNSGTLSKQEHNSVKVIMSTRSAICHPPSSHSYPISELENFWISLERAILDFAEPHRFKEMVEIQIKTLRSCKFNPAESEKIIQQMQNESDKIIEFLAQESQAHIFKLDGLKHCIVERNVEIKTCFNDRMQEMADNQSKNLLLDRETRKRHFEKVVKNTEKTEAEVKVQGRKIRRHIKRQCLSLEATVAESSKENKRIVLGCEEEITAKVTDEGKKTRSYSADQLKRIEDKLTDAGKVDTGFTVMFQKISAEIKVASETQQEQNRDINSQLINQDQELQEIKKAIMEIKGLGKTSDEAVVDRNKYSDDKKEDHLLSNCAVITAARLGSVILDLNFDDGAFESPCKLRSAIRSIISKVLLDGNVDTNTENTINVTLTFKSCLSEEERHVLQEILSMKIETQNSGTISHGLPRISGAPMTNSLSQDKVLRRKANKRTASARQTSMGTPAKKPLKHGSCEQRLMFTSKGRGRNPKVPLSTVNTGAPTVSETTCKTLTENTTEIPTNNTGANSVTPTLNYTCQTCQKVYSHKNLKRTTSATRKPEIDILLTNFKPLTDITEEKRLKLFKCISDIARPIICSFVENHILQLYRGNFKKYLEKHIHFFYHQRKSSVRCCECPKDEKIHQSSTMSRLLFNTFYCNKKKSARGHIKKEGGELVQECLHKYKVKRAVSLANLDINTLSFILKTLTVKPQDKSALDIINEIQQRICRERRGVCLTDCQLLNGVWDELEKSILALTNQYLKKIIKLQIQAVKGHHFELEEFRELASKFDKISKVRKTSIQLSSEVETIKEKRKGAVLGEIVQGQK